MHLNIQYPYLVCLLTCFLNLSFAYSPSEDARIIAEYKRSLRMKEKISWPQLNHALIARQLVHQANWTSMGTISTNEAIKDYPMVNIISINDNDINEKSTGHIQFLLTDLDFTGPDWEHNNKVTVMFSMEQNLHCSKSLPNSVDPMEPTCPRAMISGKVKKLDTNSPGYKNSIAAFIKRHPSANNWLKAHTFYLCELEIKNIFVLDFYGGPHTVKSEDYYKVNI